MASLCLPKGVCKKKMRLVNIRAPNAVAIGHSLNLKGSTDSSGKKHWLSIYKVFVMLKIKGQQCLFLKLFFLCKIMVCKFSSIDPSSYFAIYLWVQYRNPRSEKLCWFSIKNLLIWCIECPFSTKIWGVYGFFQTHDTGMQKFSKMAQV